MALESAFTLSIFFAIFAMLGYGIIDLLAFLLSRKINPIQAPLWTTALSVLFLLFGIPFFRLPAISIADILWIVFGASTGVIAILSFFKGLNIGKIAVVVPIANTWSIVSVIIGVFLLNEALANFQVLGIVLAISGTVLVSFKLADVLKLKFGKIAVGAEYAVLTLITWGIFFTVIGIISKQIGWYWATLFTQTIAAVMLLGYLVLRKERIAFPSPSAGRIILYGLILAISFLFLNASISYGYVAISAPIAASSPLVTVVLGALLLRERVERNQILGIAVILLGIVLVSA